MLTHLRITDFALLDDVEVEFGPGFNVLTGETGAGKSLLVEAVALLRGGRASADVVRAGAEEARVEAIFEPPHGPAASALVERLARAGIDPVDEGLVVRRVIGKSGRGRVYINNVLATASADYDGKPLLVAGTFGKGRTLAWTSDIGPHWLPPEFAAWSGYARLWRQALEWLVGGG